MADETATATATAPQPTSAAGGRAPITTAPCFCCGSTTGVPTGFLAWWGPAGLFGAVQCVDCPNTYQAKSGAALGPTIWAFHLVYFVAGLGLGVSLAYVGV